MPELKLCKCGQPPVIETGDSSVRVICERCKAKTKQVRFSNFRGKGYYQATQEASELWNKKADK